MWRSQIPLLTPLGIIEDKGIEDPRIVQIERQYLLTYTAYDGYNALGALVDKPIRLTPSRHFTNTQASKTLQ